jgi:integrase
MASVHRNRTKTGWIVRWRDASHKPHWKTVPGPKANALKVARDIEQRQALGPLYEAPAETLGGFLAGWLERYKQRVRESTYLRRVDALRALGVLEEKAGVAQSPAMIRTPSDQEASGERKSSGSVTRRSRLGTSTPALSSQYLQNLTTAEVEDALSTLAARAPRQAQIALASLKLALRDAENRGQRFDQRIFKIAAPRYEEREPRFLTWEQVQSLASRMPESVKRIVPVAALTGLRQGELFSLKEDDLDLENGVLRVRQGKTKAARRTVNLPPLAVQLLREQLVARRHTADAHLVFPAPEGEKLISSNFMERFYRPAVKQAGLEVDFHAMRHTYASLMIAAGVREKTIAAQLGHADGGVLVMRRYGHLYGTEGKSAAAALERMLQAGEAKGEEETGT